MTNDLGHLCLCLWVDAHTQPGDPYALALLGLWDTGVTQTDTTCPTEHQAQGSTDTKPNRFLL